MKKCYVAGLALAIGLLSHSAKAVGWPANYEGVMLQGFYWDSYDDTKWTQLTAQSDELSQYFKLIWVPNSACCNGDGLAGGSQMGYAPMFWFNHNSSFGTEAELKTMISTFKQKGTGIIEDVVINHRNGQTDWATFPTETWAGITWHIGYDGICSTDEVKNHSDQPKPTGAPDTGDDFDGFRDLDHTNATVQANCIAYTTSLLSDEIGYVGFRYDMVKGFSGQYVRKYNLASKPTYSVGEYWDSYDNVAKWIEATGKESAAFDFPFKFAVNKAFSSGDMTNLARKNTSNQDQPAGLIHNNYSQYAVTFIDNHDTARDGSAFPKSDYIEAANAFMLMSPGTPCVFWKHWAEHKEAIKKMISARNAVGIHNNSTVRVIQLSNDCYMAEITGTKGKAVVKIGSAMVSPEGYANSQIATSGKDYCIWTTNQGGQAATGGDVDKKYLPSTLYVLGDMRNNHWNTSSGRAMTRNGNKFTADVVFEPSEGNTSCYFSLSEVVASSWDGINSANRVGAWVEHAPVTVDEPSRMMMYKTGVDASMCSSWSVAEGCYTVTADFDNMMVSIVPCEDPGDDDPQPVVETRIIYLENAAGWDESNENAPYVWAWVSDTENCTASGSWPGDKMTFNSTTGYWEWRVPQGKSLPKNILFSSHKDNKEVARTDDLTYYDTYHYKTDGTTTSSGAPSSLIILGNLEEGHWLDHTGIVMTQEKPGVFKASNVHFVTPAASAHAYAGVKAKAAAQNAYFSLSTGHKSTWDELNANHNRYGAATDNATLQSAVTSPMRMYNSNGTKDGWASGCKPWSVAPGYYDVEANFNDKTMTVTKVIPTGINDINGEVNTENEDAPAEYFNLQGQRITAPAPGQLVIMRRGTTVTKLIAR